MAENGRQMCAVSLAGYVCKPRLGRVHFVMIRNKNKNFKFFLRRFATNQYEAIVRSLEGERNFETEAKTRNA